MEPQHPIFTVEPPGTPPPRRPMTRASGGFAGILAAVVLVAAKFGGTFLSMFFMIWVYSLMFGWKFAAGIVFLIFVHEMGHFVAAMALRIPVSAPIFIPFVGASIIMRQNPRDAVTEAIMAYAGPLAGGVGSWITLWAAQAYGIPWLVPVAAFSFGINLFNLIPIPPLDGGRVCAAVSRWFWVAGVILLALAVVYFHAWSMLLIGALVFWMAFRRIRDDMMYRAQMGSYYRIPFLLRLTVAAFYLGLIGILFLGLSQASQVLPAVQTQADGAYDSGQ
jgi:Zn-dependent protease